MLPKPTLIILFLIGAVAAISGRNTLRSKPLAKRHATRSTGNGVKADVYRKRQATRAGVIARRAMPRDMCPRASIAPAILCGSSVAGTPYRIIASEGEDIYGYLTRSNRFQLLYAYGDANSDIFIFNPDCSISIQGSTGGERLSVDDVTNTYVAHRAPGEDINVGLICSTDVSGDLTCVTERPTKANLAEFRLSASTEITFYPVGDETDPPVQLTVVPA